MLQLLYSRTPPLDLAHAATEYSSSYAGAKLNASVMKALKDELVSKQANSEPGAGAACRLSHAHAFAAMTSVLAATQSAEPAGGGVSILEKLATSLLSGEYFPQNGKLEEVSWAAILDCSTIICAVEGSQPIAAPRRRQPPAPPDLATRLRLQTSATSTQATLSSMLAAEEDVAGVAGVAEDEESFEPVEEAEDDVRLDSLERGPALLALVRFLEHCTRSFPCSADVAEGTSRLPFFLGPLVAALDSQTLHHNAKLFIAKALLRLHARAQEAAAVREAAAATSTGQQGVLSTPGVGGSFTLSGLDGAAQRIDLVPVSMDTETAAPETRGLPLARRGRPKGNITARFSALIAPPLFTLFASNPADSGGLRLHDTLRQACWAAMDWDALWLSSTAMEYDSVRPSLAALVDLVGAVALLGDPPPGSAWRSVEQNAALLGALLRRGMPTWPDMATLHPDRAPFAAILKEEPLASGEFALGKETEVKRKVALRLLMEITSAGSGVRLDGDSVQADELAISMVRGDLPAGTSKGSKPLFVAAGTLLGRELALRAQAGEDVKALRWFQALQSKTDSLQQTTVTVEPFVYTLAAIAQSFTDFPCRYAERIGYMLTSLAGDPRWAALEAATAAAAAGGVPALWGSVQPALPSLCGLMDAGAEERLLKLLQVAFLHPSAWTPGAAVKAATGELALLQERYGQHRATPVRRAFHDLLRALAAWAPELKQSRELRLALLLAVTDADLAAATTAREWWDAECPRGSLSERLAALLEELPSGADAAAGWPRAVTSLLLALPQYEALQFTSQLPGTADLVPGQRAGGVQHIDTTFSGGSLALGTQAGAHRGTTLGSGTLMATQGGTLGDGTIGPSLDVGGLLSATQAALPAWLRDADGSSARQVPRRRLQRPRLTIESTEHRPTLPRSVIREEVLKAGAAMALHKVEMTRTYRAGDFPDVAVSRADLVVPLARLVARNSAAAAALMESLAAAAWREDGHGPSKAQGRMRDLLAHAFVAPAEVPQLLSALLSTVLAEPTAWQAKWVGGMAQPVGQDAAACVPLVDATHAAACVGQAAAGALLAERSLLRVRLLPSVPSGTRRRASSSAATADGWRGLARSLRVFGEEETSLAVLCAAGGAGAARHEALLALRAQLSGDGDTAVEHYAAAVEGAEEEAKQLVELIDGSDDRDAADAQRAELVSSQADAGEWRREREALLQAAGRWSDVWSECGARLGEDGGAAEALPSLWRRAESDASASATVTAFARAAPRLGHGSELLTCLNAIKDSPQRSRFELTFALELAAANALQPDHVDSAHRLLTLAAAGARASWSTIPKGALNARAVWLSACAPLVELSEAVEAGQAVRQAGALGEAQREPSKLSVPPTMLAQFQLVEQPRSRPSWLCEGSAALPCGQRLRVPIHRQRQQWATL